MRAKLRQTVKRAILQTTSFVLSRVHHTQLSKERLNELHDELSVLRRLVGNGLPRATLFEPKSFMDEVLEYLDSLKVGPHVGVYKYSARATQPCIYASVYACLLLSMFSRLEKKSMQFKADWLTFLNSFQQPEDGLFYDPVLQNEIFAETDWWGARHLFLHLIPAFVALGGQPKYELHFLSKYKSPDFIKNWLNEQDWNEEVFNGDFDNKIMNIASALQYSRDFLNDSSAAAAVECIQECLLAKMSESLGLWGYKKPDEAERRARSVRFTYHLTPIFLYDGIEYPFPEKLIGAVLETQNQYGGFAPDRFSSACEDIDSIEPLIRLSHNSEYRQTEVLRALRRGFAWVLSNQNDDGGFVFYRNRAFRYGHPEMATAENESALFPTWFRCLSIAYLHNFLSGSRDFLLIRAPGLVFP